MHKAFAAIVAVTHCVYFALVAATAHGPYAIPAAILAVLTLVHAATN